MLEEEEVIYNMLEEQLGVREIGRLLGVSKNKVIKVRDDGRWYVDIITNEKVFTSKNITKDKQHFYLLYHNLMKREEKLKGEMNLLSVKEKVILSKSLNIRIATFLNLKSDTTRNWIKNKRYLVSPEYCDSSVLSVFIEEYLEYQDDEFGNNFYRDEDGFIKGHKLNYIKYRDNRFNRYINNQCEQFYPMLLRKLKYTNLKSEDKQQRESLFLNLLAQQLGIELCEWVDNQVKDGYTFEECMKCLRSYEEYGEAYGGKLVPPQVIYYKTDGFALINDEMRFKIINQLSTETIVGKFKISRKQARWLLNAYNNLGECVDDE